MKAAPTCFGSHKTIIYLNHYTFKSFPFEVRNIKNILLFAVMI